MENDTILSNSSSVEVNEYKISDLSRHMLIGFMVLISVVGIPGNITVIIVQTKIRSKTNIDFFVLAIAVSDLVSATLSTTCYILRFERSIWKVIASIELCRLHACLIFFTSISTGCLLIATAIDRYKQTMAVSSDRTHLTAVKAKRISVGIFLLSLGFGVLFSFNSTLDVTMQMCSFFANQVNSIVVGVLIVSSVIMYSVVIFCYVKISVIIWRHRRERSRVNVIAQNRTGNENKIMFKTSKVHPVQVISDGALKDIVSDREERNSPTRKAVVQKGVFLNEHNEYYNKSTHDVKENSNDCSEIDKCAIFIIKSGNHGDAQGRNESTMTYCAATYSKSTTVLSKLPEQRNRSVFEAVQRERKIMNNTIFISFLITFVYVGTWMVTWITAVYTVVTGSTKYGLAYLIGNLYMINAMTNPIFYITISHRFRENARKLCCYQN